MCYLIKNYRIVLEHLIKVTLTKYKKKTYSAPFLTIKLTVKASNDYTTGTLVNVVVW